MYFYKVVIMNKITHVVKRETKCPNFYYEEITEKEYIELKKELKREELKKQFLLVKKFAIFGVPAIIGIILLFIYGDDYYRWLINDYYNFF